MAMAENIGLVVQVQSSPVIVISPNTLNVVEFTVDDIKEEKKFVFKDPTFQHSKAINKKKAYRSLKQIISQEKSLPWPSDAITYSSITAPPSFLPSKKYSDISGLQAKYTDPQTKLYYAMAEEFATVRSLPSDIIAGYLSLRGANNPIG